MAAVAGLVLSVPAVGMLGLGLLGQPCPQGPVCAIPVIVAVVIAVACPVMMMPTRRVPRQGTAATSDA